MNRENTIVEQPLVPQSKLGNIPMQHDNISVGRNAQIEWTLDYNENGAHYTSFVV